MPAQSRKKKGKGFFGEIIGLVLVALALFGIYISTGISTPVEAWNWAKYKSGQLDGCIAQNVGKNTEKPWLCEGDVKNTLKTPDGVIESKENKDTKSSESLFEQSPSTLSGISASTIPADVSKFDPITTINSLKVDGGLGEDGYQDASFMRWLGGTCDTRESLLRDNGTNVSTNELCQVESGQWKDVYNAQTIDNPNNVVVDSIVPLKYAYSHGAKNWDETKRNQFANDKTVLALISQETAQKKSNQSFSSYSPEDDKTKCSYAKDWVRISDKYGLSISPEDKKALSETINKCKG